MTDATPRSLTSGRLRPTVFYLALPVLAEQLLSYLVGLVDTYLSGQLAGIATIATSAVGLAGYVSWLATLMFGLVGIGTTAIVARSWGAGKRSQANRVANQSLMLAAGLGVVFLCMMLPAAPAFASLLDMHGIAGEITTRYLRIDAFGLVFTSVTFAGAAALRGTGGMRTPMLVLGLVNVLNIVCSLAFVYGIGPWPKVGLNRALIAPLGVDGIVLGTVVARTAGGLMMLYAISQGAGGLRLRPKQLRPKLRVARRILSIGVPAAADGMVMWVGHFLFLMVISRLATGDAGEAIFAAHVIGIRVEAITYLPAVAWGAAAATLVGQSLGAGLTARAKDVGHEAVRQCLVVGVVMTAVLFFGAKHIYGAMHSDAAVGVVGVPALRLLACFQIPVVLSIVYVFALRGAGDTRWPLLMTCIGVLGVRVPLSYFCGIILDGGLVGAWIGMCGDLLLRSILAAARFASGRWANIRV
ncbi:MAG: MATE family efflux transporter [Planctomycetota bacterium]|nr:MATE family efflux transporter [Planctomycetota bacterium]